MFGWDILTDRRVQGSLFSNCYWNRNFILGTIWISHNDSAWFCTWCACINWCLPVIGGSWRKCALVSNTIFSIWCSAMIYRDWLSLWIIVICLWLNLNSHRYFVFGTIWVCHHYCSWFIAWSCCIYWCFPIICCTCWKVTLIGDTRSGTWSISMFCWDIFTNWCVVVRLFWNFDCYWDFFVRSIRISNNNGSWFIAWGRSIYWCLPVIFSISW